MRFSNLSPQVSGSVSTGVETGGPAWVKPGTRKKNHLKEQVQYKSACYFKRLYNQQFTRHYTIDPHLRHQPARFFLLCGSRGDDTLGAGG
jgi:hypothetical protein